MGRENSRFALSPTTLRLDGHPANMLRSFTSLIIALVHVGQLEHGGLVADLPHASDRAHRRSRPKLEPDGILDRGAHRHA